MMHDAWDDGREVTVSYEYPFHYLFLHQCSPRRNFAIELFRDCLISRLPFDLPMESALCDLI